MRIWKTIVCCCVLAGLISAARADAAVRNAAFSDTDTGVAYAFECADYPYLRVKYSTADESGSVVLTGRDGAFEGELLLPFRQKAPQARLEILTPSGKTLFQDTVRLSSPGAPKERRADAGAATKVTDLRLTAGEKEMSLAFTAPGHHQVVVQVSSVMHKAAYVLEEQADGAFQDTLRLPYINARDMVTVTLKSLKGRELAKAQERVLFNTMDAGETAAEGPLKGVKVCIDPGHQALEVHAGKVAQYPGAAKRVSGGDSTMAQGRATMRKESVCVLELSYRMCRMMRELGAEVVMTRWSEEVSVTNMERANYANDQNADYFLRIHLNNSSKGTNNAVYVYGPSNSPYAKAVMPIEQYRDTAQTILDALKAATGVEGGVVRMSDQFVGNNWAKMPAFLLECGFLSTPANDWILTTDDYQEKIARGVTDGLVNVVEGRLKRFVFH